MNPFDIVKADSGPSLMPMVIFIIWLVISMVTSAQAKKKKQRQAEQRRSEQGPSPEPQQQHRDGSLGRSGEDPLAEIRRKLETLLGDRRQPETETPEPLPESRETEEPVFVRKEQPAPRKAVMHPKLPERPAPLHETLETADTFDTREVRYQNYEQEPAVPAAKEPVPAPAAAAVPEQQSEEYAARLPSLESLEQARAGVLWSEILGPPLALRK